MTPANHTDASILGGPRGVRLDVHTKLKALQSSNAGSKGDTNSPSFTPNTIRHALRSYLIYGFDKLY